LYAVEIAQRDAKLFFFFQAEDGIRDYKVTGVQTCALPILESSEAIIENWWRQGMMGGAKAHYDGIVAFSQTDFTEDLKQITVPRSEERRVGKECRSRRGEDH